MFLKEASKMKNQKFESLETITFFNLFLRPYIHYFTKKIQQATGYYSIKVLSHFSIFSSGTSSLRYSDSY